MKEGNFMKTWKKVGLGTVALASAAVLAACGSSSSSSSASARAPRIPIPSAIQTLDSSTVTDAYSMDVIGNVEEGLTRNNNGTPELALAKSIDVSKDGLTVTVKLKSGLKWSNGDKLTASDFVYAWERATDPKTASQYAYLFPEANIKNASEIEAGKAKPSTLGVTADSDTQLTLHLTTPAPYLKQLFTLAAFYPLNQKVVEQYGKQYGTSSDKTAYDGPFYFKKGSKGSWTGSNNTYTIYKNPNYYDKSAVKSTSVDIQVNSNANTGVSLYKQGKLDWTSVSSTELYPIYKNNKDTKKLPVSENEYIEYNQSGKGTTSTTVAKALKNYDIRKAISLATDAKGFINTVAPVDVPATSFTPTGSGTVNGKDFSVYAKQPYKYDTTEAKTYWEKGLKELGVTKLNISLETDSDSAVGKQTADFLSKSYESALPGLTITEKLVPFQQRLKDSENGNFDMVISLWGGDYAEPSTFINLFKDGSGFNDGKFVNTAYQDAITKATTMPDVNNTAARNKDYKTAEQALYKESSVTPLVFVNAADLVNPKLKGVVFNAVGLQFDLKEAYITK